MVYLEMIVNGLMDALEEFFNAIALPTSKHIKDGFLVSLAFLGVSILTSLLNIWCFVDWKEALTCSILLGIITLIDNSVRGNIRNNVNKIKDLASKTIYKNDVEEVNEMEEIRDGEQ